MRVNLSRQSETASQCPYKGDHQHWRLTVGDDRAEDAAWSLPDPLGEAEQVAGYLCFYPNQARTEVDGELLDA